MDRRTQLLAAACRVIARTGVRGLRVEEVAAEAGVSTALIYHHFGNRSGLVTQAMYYINDRLTETAESEVDSAVSARERLIGRILGEFAQDAETVENSAVWGEVRGAAAFDTKLRVVIAEATEHWVDQLTELISAGLEDGSIADVDDPRGVAERLSALVEGLTGRCFAGLLSAQGAREHMLAAIAAELPG